MLVPFYKYHGTGNDFILIDKFNNSTINFQSEAEIAKTLCNRKFGIGADGLIFLQPHPEYDFEMVYYNPDGSQSLCGNGSRCAVHLANRLGIINDKTYFVAIDGLHQAHIQDNMIYLAIHDVHTIQSIGDDYFLNNGSPHYICFVDDLANIDPIVIGRNINNSQTFQNSGVNVNFVKLLGNDSISIRTYERGVNNETLSCGTGAVASAIAATEQGVLSPIHVTTQGGELKIYLNKQNNIFTNICLIGPAIEAFQGQISV